MPQKKASDPAAECILRIGKNNNVVQCKEEIQNELTELYGLTAMFFTTNERYVQPFPREEDYIPDFRDSDDEEEPPVLFDADGEPLNQVDIAAQAVAREAAADARREIRRRARDKLILKLHEGAFEARRKAMETQRANERTAWGRIWRTMSLASQSRVREQEDFEEAYMTLDSVKLWELIRRTHLTHIFGDGDPIVAIRFQSVRTFTCLSVSSRRFQTLDPSVPSHCISSHTRYIIS
jgi:hypothetical protein